METPTELEETQQQEAKTEAGDPWQPARRRSKRSVSTNTILPDELLIPQDKGAPDRIRIAGNREMAQGIGLIPLETRAQIYQTASSKTNYST